jgi:hypothetical protein
MSLIKPVIILFGLLVIVPAFVAAQKNMIDNSGFETGMDGWNNNGAIITKRNVKNGNNSCAIVAYIKDKWMGIDQVLAIPKNTPSLELGAWLKTEAVEQGKDTWNTALMSVLFLDAGEKNTGEGVSICNITGNSDWQWYHKSVPVPANARKIKIMFALGNASGNFFVDDASCMISK